MTSVTAALLAVLAQSPPATPAPATPRYEIRVDAGVTYDASQFAFRFDNPSSFDTDTLVPHYFEQRYRRPHPALTIDARYGVNGRHARTSVRIGARRIIRGSDIDTFLQPDGDVATSGTDGPVSLRSWVVQQTWAAGRAGGWQVSGVLAYAQDRADFQPDDRVVTHTRPPSVTRTFITDQEFTTTRTLAVGLEAERASDAGAWRRTVLLRVNPVVSARLLVQLPQKYPGVDLTFAALGSGAGAGVTIERRAGAWRVGVRVDGDIAWRYRRAAAYTGHAVRVTAFAGR